MTTMKFIKLSTTALIGLATLMTACGKADEPANQAEEKEHDEPSRIEVILQEGILDKTEAESNDIWAKNFTPSNNIPEVFTAETSEDGKATEGKPVNLKENVWYQLRINLYNEAGKLLNDEFFDEKEMSMHQFFFTPFKVEGDKLVKDLSLINYKYGDINPKTKEYTTTPLGFIGYLKINKTGVKQMKIQIRLPHVAPPASKLDENNKPYPYDSPATRILNDVDVNIKMGVNIEHPVPFSTDKK